MLMQYSSQFRINKENIEFFHLVWGRGVIEDTTYLMNIADKLYWL